MAKEPEGGDNPQEIIGKTAHPDPGIQGSLSLESIISSGESVIGEKEAATTAESELQRLTRQELERKYEAQRSEFRGKLADYEAAGHEIDGALFYAVLTSGRNPNLLPAITRDSLKHQIAYGTDVLPSHPDVVLDTYTGSTTKENYWSNAERWQNTLDVSKEMVQQVKDMRFFVESALNGDQGGSRFTTLLERPARNPVEFIDSLEANREKKMGWNLSREWYYSPGGEVKCAGTSEINMAELKSDAVQYQTVLDKVEKGTEAVWGHKSAALGFGRLALEQGDIETAIYAFRKTGQLEDPRTLSLLKKQIDTLSLKDEGALRKLLEALKAAKSGAEGH